MQKPTIGRVVIYKLGDSEKILLRCLSCNVVDVLPAIIVNVWSDTCINAKVLVDGGIPDLWKTSINEGSEQGQWSWPEIKRKEESVL